jgi:threonine dehydrogenase-like Zn-dependent dehydrogenase
MAHESIPQDILACMLTGAGMGYFCEYTGPADAAGVDASACQPPRDAAAEQLAQWEQSSARSLLAFARIFLSEPPEGSDARDFISALSHEHVDIAPFATYFRPQQIPNYEPAEGESLAKVQAICLCFSDCKIIHQGGSHFRLHGRDLSQEPNVPGHEGCLQLVKLGPGTAERHGLRVGDRYAIQADIYVDGVTHAYGYHHRGCMQQYTLIPEEVLDNDRGNCLIPIDAQKLDGRGPFAKDTTNIAETALAEPWGCVTAKIEYRKQIKDGGTTLFVGAAADDLADVKAAAQHAGRILLLGGEPDALTTDVDAEVVATMEVVKEAVGEDGLDDVIIREPEVDAVEQAAALMAPHAIMLLPPFEPGIEADLDIGAIHYEGLYFMGQGEESLAEAYARERRTTLKPGGRAMFIGAGGPMGQIWLQIAIDRPEPPSWMLVTEIDDARLEHLEKLFRPQAEAKGIDLHFANPLTTDLSGLVEDASLDDLVGLTPAWGPIKAAERFVAADGLINVFAGIKVGNRGAVDIGKIASQGVTLIGNSGSAVEDLQDVIVGALRGELRPNTSVAVIGPLRAAWEAMRRVMYRETSGKICLFPELDVPDLIPLDRLGEHFPSVAEKLDEHGFWTREAEEELFQVCPKVTL